MATAATPSQQPPRVLIAGGGPAGLIASILLHKLGVSSLVIERAQEPDEWSTKSYTLVLGDRGKASLERAGCLEPVTAAGTERCFVRFFDGQTGEIKSMPKKSPGIGFTRPLLVECLEKIAVNCPLITLRRGAGVASVSTDDDLGLKVDLDDGTSIAAAHLIGADGKWSKVRQSTPSLSSRMKMITCPSFGVQMNCPTAPKGFETDATYVINPSKDCLFYVISSPMPMGGFSISMVCFDETVERYPFLAPPADREAGKGGGWEDEYSALPEQLQAKGTMSEQLEQLFREELPSFYEILEKDIFTSARVNRRVTWLKMTAGEEAASYTSEDGRVTLIGDAAHAMTPSMGEGCNTALESAVRLVDSVSSAMKKRGETGCSSESLSEGFAEYGASRPKEMAQIQEASASRSTMKKYSEEA
ncbi:hypothetical protein ACHAXT_004474 [Thalassiosira profunda]